MIPFPQKMGLCSLQHGSKDKGRMESAFFLPVLISPAGALTGIVQVRGLELMSEAMEAAGWSISGSALFVLCPGLVCGMERLGLEQGCPILPDAAVPESRHCRIHPKAVQNTREEQREGEKTQSGVSLEQRPPGETESSVPVLPS